MNNWQKLPKKKETKTTRKITEQEFVEEEEIIEDGNWNGQ